MSDSTSDLKPFTRSTPPEGAGLLNTSWEASIVPKLYTDMRGHGWLVLWGSGRWNAWPTPDAAAAYGLGDKYKFPAGRHWSAATDAEMLIDGIEERVEAHRVEAKAEAKAGAGGWLLALALLYLVTKGKRR